VTVLAIFVFAILSVVSLGLVVSAVLEATGVVILPQPKPRSATDDASIAVAGATLLLAVLTAGLAYLTYTAVDAARRQEAIANEALAQSRQMAAAADKQAAASERQASSASDTLTASWQPILVDVPRGVADVHVMEKAGDYDLSVPFRNVGTGTAILLGLGVTVMGENGPPGRMLSAIVPPGEITRLGFWLQASDPRYSTLIGNLKRGDPFEVSVSYTDQHGSPAWMTMAHVSPVRPGVWAVRQVGLYRPPGAATPYVMSGPASEDVPFTT
jgi:type II secretory pathway pseudopilin PulG